MFIRDMSPLTLEHHWRTSPPPTGPTHPVLVCLMAVDLDIKQLTNSTPFLSGTAEIVDILNLIGSALHSDDVILGRGIEIARMIFFLVKQITYPTGDRYRGCTELNLKLD